MNHESIDLEPLCVERVQVKEALIHCWTSFTILVRYCTRYPIPARVIPKYSRGAKVVVV